MKKFFVSLLILWGLCCTTAVVAYTLSDNDYSILDAIEEKLFDTMEQNNRSPEVVTDAIQSYMSTQTLSTKSTALLTQLVDDIWYVFADDLGSDQDRYMLPEDCYEDEIYSDEDERCYPRSESLEDIDLQADEYQHGDDDLMVYDVYMIESDDALVQLEGEQLTEHNLLWNVFRHVIPASIRDDLSVLAFADNPESDTYAYVQQTNEAANKRKLVLNIPALIDQDDKVVTDEGINTFIHEYAHILTLDNSQVLLISPLAEDAVLERAERQCPGYFVGEGCLKSDSYFAAFIQKFRSEKELEQAWEHEQEDDYSHQEYVSEYATTNPGEDIAESFTHFVLDAKPQGQSERDKKVLFFYDYPELLKIRSVVRGRLQSM